MSPMIETTAVGWLTVPPPPAPIASTMIVPTEAEDQAEHDRPRRKPHRAPVGPSTRWCSSVAGISPCEVTAPPHTGPGDRRPPQLVPGSGSCARRRPGSRRPRRRISSGSIPAASAPATSSDGKSPTWIASAARAPTSDRACSKTAGDGLATPIAAELTAPSSSGASPVCSSTSSTDTSQLETATIAGPAGADGEQRVTGIVERDEPQRAQQPAQQLVEVEPLRSRPAARHAAPRHIAAAARAASRRHARRPCARGRTRSRRAARHRPRRQTRATPNRSRSCERSSGTGGCRRTSVPIASINSARR